MKRTFQQVFLGGVLLASGAVAQPFPERSNLENVVTLGSVLFTGVGEMSDHGETVAAAGDLNRDGFADIAIAAPEYPGESNGELVGAVYVVFGGPSAQLLSVELESLDGSNGFRVYGRALRDDRLGSSVDGAGDVNGDGFDDLIIGANWFPSGGGGYVIFGRSDFPAVVDPSALDGSDGFRFEGGSQGSSAGAAVAGLGDFNGDGLSDFAIGDDQADGFVGEVHVGFGRRVFPDVVQLSSLDGTSGFTLLGPPNSFTGEDVAGAGDVNGDGLQDLLIGAKEDDANGTRSGAAFVVFGRTSAPAELLLADLDGTDGAVFRGDSGVDEVGTEVAAAGDVNQDGYDDLLIGAPGEDRQGLQGGTQSGTAYLVYGRESFPAAQNLESMLPGEVSLFFGVNKSDGLGNGVGSGADVNADGILDLFMGAPESDPNGNRSGEAYVVYGSLDLPHIFDLEDLDGDNGAVFEGPTSNDHSGDSLSGVGDFNGDGVSDFLIGSPGKDNTSDNPGFAHLVFGRSDTGVTFGATGGFCPGPIDFRSRGLTPLGDVELFRGSGRGTSVLSDGPCTGAELDLADAVSVSQQNADSEGVWLQSVQINLAGTCGTFVQLIDLTTCLVSNVTTLPGG